MVKKKEGNIFLYNLLLLTVFFNIWFPKAGIKFSGIPLTIGNVLLAITFVGWVLKIIVTGKVRIHKISYLILFLMIYTTMKFLLVGNFVDNIGYIIPLVIYPLIFFISYDVVDTERKEKKLIRVICLGFFFICIYSLLQYIFGIEKICIPGVTVNFTDYMTYGPQWYLQKNNLNNFGIGTKLVSTYQNGNLFGVNTLLIYPIVYKYYKENKKTSYMYLSLIMFLSCVFLSLSRACWLGIVLFVLFGIIFENTKTKNSIARKIIMIILCSIIVVVLFQFFPSIVARFSSINMNSLISMSGRTSGLVSVFDSFIKYRYVFIWLIGSQGFIENIGLAYEMTPLAIFVQIGLIGVIAFYTILYRVWKSMDKNKWLQHSVRLSILIWAIVSCIEGGLWLPPTALNLFLVLAIGILDKKFLNAIEEGK